MAKEKYGLLDVHEDMYETVENQGAAVISVVMTIIGTVIMLLLAGLLGAVFNLWILELIVCILISAIIIFWMVLTLRIAIKEDGIGAKITHSIVLVICAGILLILGCYIPYQYQKPGEYDCLCDVRTCGSVADGGFVKKTYAINKSYYCEFHYKNGAAAKKPTTQNPNSFTNKYGTPTTKCYISGCKNYIATSGDTNCCTTHSNLCLNCHCYIDSDAIYCLDCLKGSTSKK